MTLPFLQKRVSVAERAFVARQLATMLSSGLPIDRAIAVLANQVGSRNKYLITVFRQIESDLEAGLAFSSAIAKHPRVFNRVFVNVVKAGEAVGKVSEVLEDLATRLEQEHEFISKVWGAMYYPILILIGMVAVGVIMMIQIIPQFKQIFEEAQIPLPFVTQMLLVVSDFVARQWYIALLLVVALAVAARFYLASDRGKLFTDWLTLKTPTGIVQSFYMARFTRTLSLLTQSGTPIIEALAITGEVVHNHYYLEVISTARDDVSRGIPLSVPLSKSSLFPIIVPQMILVGEQTGRIDDVMQKLAIFFEEDTNNKLKALTSLFEPIMLVIIGLGVAFMVFAIFIPIYSIARFQ